jgi:uncharacterized membrane protein YbhN (UPF0104 family)
MSSGNVKKWLWRAVKLGAVLLVVWFVRRTLVDAWHELEKYEWTIHPGLLALSGGLYLLALLPAAVFWYACLRSLGQHPRLGETFRAYYIGHLGKYVPGKAMVVILRAGMIGGQRVHRGVAAASVFLETLTWLAVGSFWAAAFLAVQWQGQYFHLLLAIALMLAAGLPTLPPVFKRLARWAGVGKSDPSTLEQIGRLDHRVLLLGWGCMAVGWAIMGLSYWAALQAMGVPGDPLYELPRFSASVALATVAGFVVIFMPAGVMVREAALVSLMLPYLKASDVADPELVAWVSVALFRLVSVVSEILISGILYVVGLGGRRRRTDS